MADNTEKKDQAPDKPTDQGKPKSEAGHGGEQADDTQAGSGGRGGHRKREGGPPEGQ